MSVPICFLSGHSLVPAVLLAALSAGQSAELVDWQPAVTMVEAELLEGEPAVLAGQPAGPVPLTL